VQEAHGKVHELAVGLKGRFGKYGAGHYYSDLIRRAHKTRSTRKVNSWNAYQKLELARIKRLRFEHIIYSRYHHRGTGKRSKSHCCEPRNQRELEGLVA
jgi:hypothetical protein